MSNTMVHAVRVNDENVDVAFDLASRRVIYPRHLNDDDSAVEAVDSIAHDYGMVVVWESEEASGCASLSAPLRERGGVQ